jgi:hypothetical protein
VNKNSIKSDLARIDRMRDTHIDYSDIPPLDRKFLKKGDGGLAPGEKAIDDSSRCGRARLAQGPRQGVPDTH